MHGFHRVGEGITGQTEGQAVGLGNGVFDLLEAADRGNRTKRLVVHHIGIKRDMREHRGRKEIALRANPLTTREDLGAFGAGILHDGLHGRQATFVGQWPHLGACDRAITHLQGLRLFGKALGELVGNLVVHQKAGGRNAHLACVAELGGTGGLQGQANVSVFGQDDRRMATQLHRRALHVLTRQGGQLLAYRRGAGEGDFADQRVCDQVVRDLGGCAVDQTDDALRHACIVKRADQFGWSGWCFFGGLDDDRATGSQGSRHLAHRLVDGEVPRREGCDRAHRQFEHLLLHIDIARRHDAAIDAAAFFSKPLDDVRRRHDLHLGFAQGLALLLREQFGDWQGAFAHQRGGLAQHSTALIGGRVTPDFKALLGGLRGTLQIRNGGMRQTADFAAGGGVEHGQGAAAFGVAPVAIDEELGVGVVHADIVA